MYHPSNNSSSSFLVMMPERRIIGEGPVISTIVDGRPLVVGEPRPEGAGSAFLTSPASMISPGFAVFPFHCAAASIAERIGSLPEILADVPVIGLPKAVMRSVINL